MSKSHHQNKAEQIYKRSRGADSFRRKKQFYQNQESMDQEDIQKKSTVDEASIQPNAFESYAEEEGAVSEHWKEVDRILRNGDR